MAVAATPTTPLPETGSPLPRQIVRPAGASSGQPKGDVVLDIRNLKTYFYTYDGVVRALDGISFKVRKGETLGIAGETGCGKSVTVFSVMRLIPDPPGRIVSGKILFRGANLLWGIDREAKVKPIKNTGRVKVTRRFRRIKAANERMSAIRGRGISMIFQEPSQAMNPIFPVYDQIGEVLLLHRGPELIDGLLGATPEDPGVEPAIEALASASARNAPQSEIRELAKALADALHLPSFSIRAFHLSRPTSASRNQDVRKALHKEVRGLHLSAVEKGYLRNRKALILLENDLRATYFQEMQEGELDRRGERATRNRMRLRRYSHLYFRFPGVTRRLERPLRDETLWRSVEILEGVRIANPVQIAKSYPFELSGGMLQRVMIAMALAPEPVILMADEPTTALDVTVQAQILGLMRDLKERVGTSIVLITHDLAVLAEVADRVCIMYAGEIVENAPIVRLFESPLHPYTQGLLASIPRFDRPDKRLESIPGSVPNLITPPTGCKFHPRCPFAMPICKESRPPMTDEGDEHSVACFLYHGAPMVE